MMDLIDRYGLLDLILTYAPEDITPAINSIIAGMPGVSMDTIKEEVCSMMWTTVIKPSCDYVFGCDKFLQCPFCQEEFYVEDEDTYGLSVTYRHCPRCGKRVLPTIRENDTKEEVSCTE